MRLKLTILGTLWVVLMVCAWIWLGIQITSEDIAWFYWTLGLIVTGVITSVPFILFAVLGNDYE